MSNDILISNMIYFRMYLILKCGPHYCVSCDMTMLKFLSSGEPLVGTEPMVPHCEADEQLPFVMPKAPFYAPNEVMAKRQFEEERQELRDDLYYL